MAMFIQQIRIDEITTLPGRRELRQLDDLIESIQNVGLLEPILVTGEAPHFRIVAGDRRYNAAKRLGWSEIPAVVLKTDDLHAGLAAIDENLVRQELTTLERGEHLSRKKAIYEALHGETKRGTGPGRGHREKKRNNCASFAADTASKTGCTPRTVQQEVQIARGLSDRAKEIIRPLPIANKKTDLLRLMRLPRERQEAIAELLASGGAKSVKGAQRALNADAMPSDSAPDTHRRPQGQASAPRLPGVGPERGDRDTLLHTVIARFQQAPAIAQGQIAGRPAAEVMAERLAALPGPEFALLEGLVTGPMPLAAQAWMAAVSVDGQAENHHLEGVMPLDRTADSANHPDGLLISVNDQAEASAGSVSVASASTGDYASQGEQLRTAAVMVVPSDDGADTEMRADGDQLHLQGDRCGSCGSPRVWRSDTGSGRIYCEECHAVFDPATGRWAPGGSVKRQSPPAPGPATDTMTQEASEGRG